MAIKVSVGEQKTQEEKSFPKLMIGKLGSIVLFNENRKGTMIQYIGESSIKVGEYYEGFDMHAFTDYNDPITLQNEA